MAVCLIRVPAWAEPISVRTTAASGPQPVAMVVHAAPGEALLTCTCRGLRVAVDVDDPEIRDYLLAEHLRVDHPGHRRLPVDDTRTGAVYTVLAKTGAGVSR